MSHNHLPRILAVDDEPSVLNSIKAIFDDDYRLSTARNGKAALDLLNKNDIQLVILDLGLPDSQYHAGCSGDIHLLRAANRSSQEWPTLQSSFAFAGPWR